MVCTITMVVGAATLGGPVFRTTPRPYITTLEGPVFRPMSTSSIFTLVHQHDTNKHGRQYGLGSRVERVSQQQGICIRDPPGRKYTESSPLCRNLLSSKFAVIVTKTFEDVPTPVHPYAPLEMA